MNQIKKSFKKKSALRCADGGMIYEGKGADGERSFSDAMYKSRIASGAQEYGPMDPVQLAKARSLTPPGVSPMPAQQTAAPR